jgi:threonine dehydrogenase-like Zn-dependent dehydrogenase
MPKRLALIGDHVCDWLDYEEKPVGADQIRFRTEYASGKYGTWAALLDPGTFGGQMLDPRTRVFVPDPNPKPPQGASRERPITFGTSATGLVTEVGSAVTRFKPGDRVAAVNVDIRETNTTSQDNVHLLSDLDPLVALCAEPAYVAFHCVREGGVRYGDTVVVVGLGALGLCAVRMAREGGAERIFAVDISEGRRGLAKEFGADVVLDPRAGDPALAVHDALGGPGVDVAIELSGSTAGLSTAIRCVRIAGTVCAAGFYRGDAAGVFLGRELHHNRLTLVVPHGCGFGHPPRDYPRWDQTRAYTAIFSMMRQGRLAVGKMVDPVVDRAEAVHMFRRMRDEPDRIVKFAVKM